MKENHSAAPKARSHHGAPAGIATKNEGKILVTIDGDLALVKANTATAPIEEWRRRVGQDGQIFFERIANIRPAYQSGTPEWYRRIALDEEKRGNAGNARAFRRAAVRIEMRSMERVLGKYVYLTTNVACVLAAVLRSGRKMPKGARRWMAQHALETWLPYLPEAERHEVTTMLSQCPKRALGKELTAVLDSLKPFAPRLAAEVGT